MLWMDLCGDLVVGSCPHVGRFTFNTIIPSTLTTKLEHLGLSPSLCQWISNFLTGRPQAVRIGRHVSTSLILSTGAPQGCVLSPLLYSLCTYDCMATTNSTVIKFADDTVVVGLISDNNETAYLEEIRNLENWCPRNNLLLNVSKTKELIVDFSTKQERNYQITSCRTCHGPVTSTPWWKRPGSVSTTSNA
ncbi:hypothetical protein QTP70_021524 [Hemibagrus guttatus]|uniref:Reverse transcriptase domain-containing protein n=1 Tax=Hemibagrus guttatus TaxID=175788 RepID=A0AAE0Q5T7_9TELE|nr:hypothetical protein QTP70_021524 [Hemibagrus guttatus]KAK3538578.1 hypothetical protein QTP86_006662 [Hemibagrus guttatus]